MGTHPIFESDFDCLTEKVKEMSATDWRSTEEYRQYASGPREPKHQGSCHWVPMEMRTEDDVKKMEAGRQEYEAWLRHKGITLRNAEDNYGNPNQSEKKQPPGAIEQYNVPPDAPRPKAKGRGEMLKRNIAPQTASPPQQDPLASLPSHHEKNQ